MAIGAFRPLSGSSSSIQANPFSEEEDTGIEGLEASLAAMDALGLIEGTGSYAQPGTRAFAFHSLIDRALRHQQNNRLPNGNLIDQDRLEFAFKLFRRGEHLHIWSPDAGRPSEIESCGRYKLQASQMIVQAELFFD